MIYLRLSFSGFAWFGLVFKLSFIFSFYEVKGKILLPVLGRRRRGGEVAFRRPERRDGLDEASLLMTPSW